MRVKEHSSGREARESYTLRKKVGHICMRVKKEVVQLYNGHSQPATLGTARKGCGKRGRKKLLKKYDGPKHSDDRKYVTRPEVRMIVGYAESRQN